MNITRLIQKTIEFDSGDAKRIQHFIKVHAYSALLGKLEDLPPHRQEVLETAAVLHDIGIHAAEKKYGSSSGKCQEMEGPAIARTILAEFDCDDRFINRVCFLIAHHHTYDQVDGLDYQILLEADFLVNAYEDNLSSDGITTFAQKVFKTKSGISLLKTIYNL